jgi:hypothetical protein
MDAAPRGLAPGGPGATGAPLLDWILCDPGLAAAVFAHLAPRDVRGLRAACAGGRAAVAGHAWESTVAASSWAFSAVLAQPPLDDNRTVANEGRDFAGTLFPVPSQPPIPPHDVFGGRAALARWRACFPRARGVVLDSRRVWDGADTDVTDADVAALAAGCSQLAQLGFVRCGYSLTDAVLAPFSGLTTLLVSWTPSLTGACWAGLAGRLRSVTMTDTGPVTDAHLPALAGCTHVCLGRGAAVSDAGIAAHLSRRLTHQSLYLDGCPDFDGSCLRACTRLVDLRLTIAEYLPARALLPGALSGCAASLASLKLAGVDGGDALFTADGGGIGGLPALCRATLSCIPSLTDAAFAGTVPRLAELTVYQCPLFVGGASLGPLPGLTWLDVRHCDSFTGRALAAGRTRALQWLALRGCSRFAEEDVGGYGGGGDGGGGGGVRSLQQPSPAAPSAALPALTGALFCDVRHLSDAWFAHTPRLAHLKLGPGCDGVTGSAALGAHLPALTHLAVWGGYTLAGGWLGAAGGGASTRLEALAMRGHSFMSLPDVLAPGPHLRLRWACFECVRPPLTDELLGARLPALRTLTVTECADFVGGPGLGLLELTDLTVERCAGFTGAGLGGLPSLQSLALSECPRVGPMALAAASSGCPRLTSVSYTIVCARQDDRGGGSEGGNEEAAPPAQLLALGPGWVGGAPSAQFVWYIAGEHCVTTWTATRDRPAGRAAAAGGGSGEDYGGSDGVEEEEQGPPPAKCARVGGE